MTATRKKPTPAPTPKTVRPKPSGPECIDNPWCSTKTEHQHGDACSTNCPCEGGEA